MDESYSVVGIIDNKRFIIEKKVDFQQAVESSVDVESKYDSVEIVQDYELTILVENVLVVSDTNMMLEETMLLLDRPDSLHEQYIFLGNFISKNKGFVEYMKYLVQLKNTKKEHCVFVKGRNEYNLLEYIHGTEQYIGNAEEIQEMITTIEEDLKTSLINLPMLYPQFYMLLRESISFYENDKYILVPSGLDLTTPLWRNSSPELLITPNESFYTKANLTGKTIVFGDKPVTELHKSTVIRPWIDLETNKIGINGDCLNKGKLLALLVHGEDTHFISVRNVRTRKRSYDFIPTNSENFNKKPESIQETI